MSDSVRPHRWQPTRLPSPWDSPGKHTGVGCHFLLQCIKVKSESEVAQSCLTLVTPWTAAYQAPPSMGFSRQKYWSGVPWSSSKEFGFIFKGTWSPSPLRGYPWACWDSANENKKSLRDLIKPVSHPNILQRDGPAPWNMANQSQPLVHLVAK